MPTKIEKWDILDYLTDRQMMVEYLDAALEEGDPEFVIIAINDVARALGKEKILVDANDLGSVLRSIKSLGFELSAKAA